MAKRRKSTKRAEDVEVVPNAGMEWIGDGRFMVPGVPARDLTPEESVKWRDLIQATADNTGVILYVSVTDNSTPEEGDSDPVDSGLNEGIDHG